LGREIHLLLTDMIMPEMDGLELARQITAERGSIRVLLMTAHTDAESPLPILMKPFRMHELLDRVRQVLDGPPPFEGDIRGVV